VSLHPALQQELGSRKVPVLHRHVHCQDAIRVLRVDQSLVVQHESAEVRVALFSSNVQRLHLETAAGPEVVLVLLLEQLQIRKDWPVPHTRCYV